MKEYLIGTGGWAYFRIPGLTSLAAYAKAFNFVEVNSTFYQIPETSTVEKWRKLVPSDFRFSVRAHRSMIDKYQLQPVQQNIRVFDVMKKICDILGADVLHLQSQADVNSVADFAKNLRDFVTSVSLGKIRIALEMRRILSSALPRQLLRIMQEYDIIHSVDLSKGETPAHETDTLYTRLFGKGKDNIYQPTDGELVEIDRKAADSGSERVMMSFHFVRMYKDAARMKVYKQTGKFPRITRSTGVASLREVLKEDATYPATKRELIQSQGWKLFDASESYRTHAKELLTKLPERTYKDTEEVVEALSTIGAWDV